jgi:uncharacterized membrane protein YeaQ/YmgE (transglycosylase-associated protein family)
MLDHIVQMAPLLLIAGLMVGWLAEAVTRVGGYGLIPDMVLGLVGSVIGGGIVWVAGPSQAGMLATFLVGGGAAALAIGAQRGLWRSARLGT